MNMKLRLAKLEAAHSAKNKFAHLSDAELEERIAVLVKRIAEDEAAQNINSPEVCHAEH